ncbi:unnamed protein product [Amoebophrya sp. A25]|nr:unnamed protein product [Amoebophrya sp. A25]|eukprot:GSA25T00018780001.1
MEGLQAFGPVQEDGAAPVIFAAEPIPQNALNAMIQMNDNIARQQAVHENEGLGIPTDGQVQLVTERCQMLRHKCTPAQYLFLLRQLQAYNYEKLLKPPVSLNLFPLALVAAFRCAQIIDDVDANTLQETMMKAVTGSFDPKSTETKLSLAAVYDLFNSSMKANLAHPAPVAPGPNVQQRQLQATIVGNVLPDLISNVAIEKRRAGLEAELAKKMKNEVAQMVQHQVAAKTKQLEAEIRNLKMANRGSHRGGKSRSRSRGRADGEEKHKGRYKQPGELVCLKWMKGQCKGKNCPEGRQHFGDLKRLEFVNKDILKGALSSEEVKKLANQ